MSPGPPENDGPAEGPPTTRWGVLGEKEFRRYFVGYTTSLVGAAMVPVALTFAVLAQGRPIADVGYVLAAQTVPLVAFLLVGGVLADRWSRRALMVGADVARCASELLLAVLVITGSPPLWVFMALAGVIGAGQAFFNPAMTGLVPAIASPPRLTQANALISLASSLGQIAGPAAAGVLVATAGAGWAIAVDGTTYAVSAVCLFGLELPRRESPGPPEDGAAESVRQQLAAGWREFTSRRWLWAIVVQFGLFHLLVYAPFMVLGPVVAERHLGGATGWGIVLSAQGVGSVFGGLITLRVRPRRPLVVATAGTFAFAAPVVLLALAAPLGAVAAAAAISGAGIAVFGVLWDTTLQQQVPTEALSRVSAYDWLGSVALSPAGYALAGPMAATLGVTGALTVAAVWGVVGSAAVMAVPEVRRVVNLGDG